MAGGKKDEKEKLAPIIIKRIKKGGGGHHGGAWKVAYADFVTAMMAFFLLLWLLNVTTDEQKNAISNYFDPSHPKVSEVTSGAGSILAGLTVSLDGAMVSNVQPVFQPEVPETSTRGVDPSENHNLEDASEQQLEEELRKKEDERFKQAEAKLKAEIEKSPSLKDLEKNLIIDITPEGMRIQIVDDKGRSMFPSGSAVMYPFMRELLLKVTSVITPLPNQVSIRGHTDSAQYRDPGRYDNWNLSADRAQASRRVMVEGKLPEKRIENVMGRSDRDPLDKDPASPRNRRISILLLRERFTQAALDKMKAEMEAAKKAAAQKAQDAAKKTAADAAGLQIVDDTKPAETPKKQADTPSPLPVSPVPDKFQRQPQVLSFGAEGAQKPESLYDGPAQNPYIDPRTNKPPTITKKLFDLDDDDDDAPAQDGARINVPAQKDRRSIDFGDPVPAPSRPLAAAPLPPAASLRIENKTDETKALTFGETPALQLTPAQPKEAPKADLQLINPRLSPKVLELDAAPQAEPRPGLSAPAAPQSSADQKELTF